MHRGGRSSEKNTLPRLYARVLALLTMLLLLPAAASAQWTTPDASGNTNTTAVVNNVGIGTASPTSKLDVTGSAAVSQDLKVGAGRLKFTFSGPEGQMQGVTERLSFWTPNSSSVQTMRMRIGGLTSSYVEFLNVNSVYLSSTSSKFGIGTSNPTSRLHVLSGTDSATSMLSLDTGTHGGTSWTVGGTANNESTLDMSVYRAGSYVSRFGVSNYGHVYLQPNGGLVGVGTAVPEGVFDVRGGYAPTDTPGLPIILSAQQGAGTGAGGNVIINAGSNGSNSTNGQLIFGTGGVISGGVLTTGERMRIDDTGRVGIGTPTPGFKLDVSGQIRSSSGGFVFPDGTVQATAASSVTYGSSAGTAVQGNTTLTITAGTGMSGGGPVTLGAGGTLTLNNSDPGSSQNIFKNVGNAAGATQFSAGSNADTLRFEGTGATSVSFDAANRKVVINSSAASSGWTDAGSSVSLTSATANVGIGTASPTFKLSVEGNAYTVGGSGAPFYEGFRVKASDSSTNGGYLLFGKQPGSGGYGVVQSGDSVAYRNLSLNPSGGNVGIGTATPAAKLHVNGTTLSGISAGTSGDYTSRSLVLTARPLNDNTASLGFDANSTYRGTLDFNGTSGQLAWYTNSGSAWTTNLVISAGGNVGVGNTSPSYKLDVSGQVRSSSGGFVFPDGTIQATASSPVSYGSSAGTAVQGNTTLTITAGAGMSGGGPVTLGAGGTLTLANNDKGSAQNIFKNVSNAAGATQFSAGTNNDSILFEGTGATTISFNAGAKKVTINSPAAVSSGWTDAGANVSLTSATAKVGMGTSNPSAGLDVQTPVTAATAYGTRLQQTITAGTNNGVMTGLYVNPTFNDGMAVGNVHNALATGAGNVGIGTTATGAGLDVQNAGVVSGGASYGVRLQQTIPSATNNAISTAVYINPTFSDGQAVGVKHNGLVVTSGNVGIGTVAPQATLDVVGSINATQTINATGAITGGSIQARYQDVAEWVPSTQKLSAGTVVVLDTNQMNHVLASTKAYDTGVAGVVSDSPGVILGQGGEDKLKVATTGRVRVKVDATVGAIHVGDLLVTSNVEGVAMKSVEVDLGGVKIHRPGTIIGKALEPLVSGTGEILVLLSLQ